MNRYILFDKDNEYNETDGTVIHKNYDKVDIFFKNNEAGKKARELWRKLNNGLQS